ncbi:RasGAP protein [Malassezia cuniculi]|uniref:RasGAP protein n=1 Tax=Malassezia cuniculi TaxID=948313 RepID=A0AAF0EY31_9BASI|nr:RasGAP protein [Malassezia cuniculi]
MDIYKAKGTTSKQAHRNSVSTLVAAAAQNDLVVHDDLAKAQEELGRVKQEISSYSKTNYVLECDVRYLDSRIAMLIANRMALDEQGDLADAFEDAEVPQKALIEDRRIQQYSNLFYILQSEPRHIASLCRLVSISDMDTLLQTVMFTLYGNQYESREEHLLLSMFQSVLSHQFDSESEFGSLLRANTPVSRMMATYTGRVPGKSYLKHVLVESLRDIVVHDAPNLEINPHCIYEELVESGMCQPGEHDIMSLPAVQRVLQPRVGQLQCVTENVLEALLASADQVPYGVRWICKQIRSLARRKFPEVPPSALCSLVGAFFVLRFVNPAIVSPHAYLLVKDVPTTYARRTLTLVAKLLQHLVNQTNIAKEEFMRPLHGFFEVHRERMNEFLHTLCNVGDFYDTLEFDQYMALTRRDLSISISLNELYHMHALVKNHIDILAPGTEHHLRVIVDELGPAPMPVPRREDYSFELHLFNRWETTIRDLSRTLMTENNMTRNDLLYLETKSIFVQLLRSLPELVDQRPVSLSRVTAAAIESNDPVLQKKAVQAQEMLAELETLRIAGEGNQQNLLADEIATELEHLGNTRNEVLAELKNLSGVLNAIREQHDYLRSQLDTYVSYLQNARIAGSTREGSCSGGLSVVSIGNRDFKYHRVRTIVIQRFTYAQFERDGVIKHSIVPLDRRAHIYFQLVRPRPGTYAITLNYKGYQTSIVEMELNVDDLLEKAHHDIDVLDFEYVQLSVMKLYAMLRRAGAKRK